MKNWQRIKNEILDKNIFFQKSFIIDFIRQFFKNQNFLEVDTPLLVKNPGTEPFLEVFQTTLKLQNYQDQSAFLITSPEYQMKKLLAAGFEQIFQITKSFRNNEGLSFKHNSEFTILEWYRQKANYFDLMHDCEMLLSQLITHFNQLNKGKNNNQYLYYQNKKYNLQPPFDKITVRDAFNKFARISEKELLSKKLLLLKAKKKGYQVKQNTTWEEIYNQIFLNEIEPKLGQEKPIFVYDYPISQASLAIVKKENFHYAERFELYLAGFELGNAFSELINGSEQKKRLQNELLLRRKLKKYFYNLDDDFIDALNTIVCPCAGIAMGIDRICMLLLDQANIEDLLFFPLRELFEL